MTSDKEALAMAARQGGVVSLEQATELGFTRHMRAGRIRSKAWDPIGRIGYRLLPLDDHLSLLRASVALLPGAVVSHGSAAVLTGIWVSTATPTVTVHTRTTHTFPGVQVHRGHDLVAAHQTIVGGLPTTRPERTMIDLAAHLDERDLSRQIQDLVIKGMLSLERPSVVSDAVCRRGRPGSAAMRSVLASLMEQAGPQSELERRGRELLSFGMLPQPHHEWPIPWSQAHRFDDAYPEKRVAIEWDSRSWHATVAAMDSDRGRDRACSTRGWVLLRFTWADVTRRQNDVIEAVRAALLRSVS